VSEGPAQARRLVGRDDDLADLTATFRSVQAGRMAAVVLCGEAGAGKTSLVQELAARAAADGAIVLRGGGLDIAESPPFWPVASALRSLLGSADSRAAEVLAPWTEQLDDLLALGGRPASPAAGTAAPGAQILELLRHVVADLARRAPVVFVVDDLQWVDHSTRDLLVYLIANLAAEPVLLLVTYRSDAHPDTSATRALIAELQRHRQVRCAEVLPLSRAAVAEIVERSAPGRPELVELVWTRSAGNAFIVEETLRAALEGEPHALPRTLRDLVSSRLETLSPAAQRVVRTVAVAYGPLPHELLATVVDGSGNGEQELLDALRESVDRGVVIVDPGAGAGEG
jgi:predicted ATPase